MPPLRYGKSALELGRCGCEKTSPKGNSGHRLCCQKRLRFVTIVSLKTWPAATCLLTASLGAVMQYRDVNLEKLKPYLAPGVFTKISPEVEKEIEVFPEVHERIKGCVAFCHQIGQGHQSDEIDQRRKYLRAALAEFVSLEDAAKIDCPQGSVSGSSGILSLDDARLHTVRLLRHANVHLSACTIDKTSRPASWNGPGGVVDFDYTVFFIPNIRDSIVATRQANKYSPSDIDAMIRWIEKEQMEWGIGHLILKSAELFAAEFLLKCT
ncbi:MAG: hypothetical protein PHS32_08745 [Rhodoferax sp.]|uniref:hypothetical protein n=1 Tax=Rhodoferax sp. TaxID=50421 RepID=UPI00260885CE|nr:hypothetical protein [Rhodoferax sp.]MDD5333822.1 hypothetical protein [Rhodoferax sp.]